MPPSQRFVPIKQLGPRGHISPLRLAERPRQGVGRFVSEDRFVRDMIEVWSEQPVEETLFERAGPRRQLFFDPPQTRAAIVTCGGLCPGLNNVIRSLYLELHFNYGVREVLGIRHGYLGLNPRHGQPPVTLSRELVRDIHTEGGTVLGTSRGPQDVGRMVDFLEQRQINILFCVGGDGTQRGADALVAEAERRGLPIAIVGIPKTIDSDILYCDRTFGYSTAIEAARDVIHQAHTEANGPPRGIGLVKLMGREAGFIACGATIVSQEVNFALIPEIHFELHGENGLLTALDRRLDARHHAVVVVAEGAGQHLFGAASECVDASGNCKFHDIGPRLKHEFIGYFTERGKPVDVKYIDPSYIIRSVRANCDDAALCDRLARHAAHAAMAGKTDLIIGLRHGEFIHVPIEMAVARKRRVDPEGDLWAAVLQVTGQPPRFA